MCSIIGYLGHRFTPESIRPYFDRTLSRGPDMSRILPIPGGFLGFHRLAIMGLNEMGMQPFVRGDMALVCNGEIYGFRAIRETLQKKGYLFHSDSDCEILLPLYAEMGVEMFRQLDAEFAMILFDGKSLIAARDPIGIRPLYYGYDADGQIIFASEAKNLVGLCAKIMPFPPGHYYKDGKFICYRDMSAPAYRSEDDLETACRKIREKLTAGIEKRLDADAPVGFLLSGGLDSSLVCAVAARCSKKPIRTFSIGMDIDAIDLKYAREVADYLGADHTEVIITKADVLEALPKVVALLGTAVGSAVCTVRNTVSSSRLPMPWATATPAPTERPKNRLMIRLMMAPVEPTAATAMLPQYLPTTIRSAALNNSCNTLVSIMGTA